MTTNKKPLSKRVRFSVFERDGFQCQYCGRQPPTVCLEADHIVPRSKGGTNDPENLRTSCYDCNRGKGAKTLFSETATPEDRLRRAQEAAEESVLAEALAKARKDREALRQEACNAICDAMCSESCKKASITTVCNKMRLHGAENIVAWLDKAVSVVGRGYTHTPKEPDMIRYFCGICNHQLDNRGNSDE